MRSRTGSGNLAERQLLLDCLMGFFARPDPPRIATLSEDDAADLIALSSRHRVCPLLYWRLTRNGPCLAIRDHVLQTLRERFLLNRAKNGLLYHELAQVLRALHQDNIPVLLLKGSHLAASVYDDIALRMMNDIDLMVAKSDLEKTTSRLRELGYVATHQVQDLEGWCQRNRHMPGMSKPPGTTIEVHWTIATPSQFGSISPAGLWDRSQPFSIAGVPARVLSTEDLLLHLSLHAASNAYGPFRSGLSPLCDIAAVASHHQARISWPQLASRAFEWKVSNCVYMALRLAKELLTAPIPESVLKSLRAENFDEQWARLAANQVLPRGTASLPPEVSSASRLLRAYGSQTRRGRLPWLLQTAFPPRDFMAGYMAHYHSLPLTPVRNYTCYITRAIDWLGKGMRVAWHALIHRRMAAAGVHQTREETLFCRWLNGIDSPTQPSKR